MKDIAPRTGPNPRLSPYNTRPHPARSIPSPQQPAAASVSHQIPVCTDSIRGRNAPDPTTTTRPAAAATRRTKNSKKASTSKLTANPAAGLNRTRSRPHTVASPPPLPSTPNHRRDSGEMTYIIPQTLDLIQWKQDHPPPPLATSLLPPLLPSPSFPASSSEIMSHTIMVRTLPAVSRTVTRSPNVAETLAVQPPDSRMSLLPTRRHVRRLAHPRHARSRRPYRRSQVRFSPCPSALHCV